jgi:hypothetical protein
MYEIKTTPKIPRNAPIKFGLPSVPKIVSKILFQGSNSFLYIDIKALESNV